GPRRGGRHEGQRDRGGGGRPASRPRHRAGRPLRAHASRAARVPAPPRRPARPHVRAGSLVSGRAPSPEAPARSGLWRLRWRNATRAAGTGLSALSSAVTMSTCAKPSAITTSKPAGMPPNVGKAVFGTDAFTTRGVEPVQLGAVQVPMLFPNPVQAPGTVPSP